MCFLLKKTISPAPSSTHAFFQNILAPLRLSVGVRTGAKSDNRYAAWWAAMAGADDRLRQVLPMRVVWSRDQRTDCRDATCDKPAFGQIKDK